MKTDQVIPNHAFTLGQNQTRGSQIVEQKRHSKSEPEQLISCNFDAHFDKRAINKEADFNQRTKRGLSVRDIEPDEALFRLINSTPRPSPEHIIKENPYHYIHIEKIPEREKPVIVIDRENKIIPF